MVGEEGRYQCTKGIWLGKAARSPTLVMDVEGTDGRERGDAEVAFEKKTSLFSLALAEVLIVNMWMQDIGRNNAANLPLLKTVLEINLQLFQHEKRSKTLLLFVVRDHVRQATPLEKLQTIIEKDLRDIWSGINKPEKFKNSLATDFFEFQFASLPHKVLEGEKFAQELSALSERFNNPESSGYIWSKNLKSSIPADGFAMFAQKIWETILENKDLDLPSQREILATFRCDEIAAEAFARFEETLASTLGRQVGAEKKVVSDFGSQCDSLLDAALSSYAETAKHYLPEIVEKKKDALSTSMLKGLFLFEIFKIQKKKKIRAERLVEHDVGSDARASRTRVRGSVAKLFSSWFQRSIAGFCLNCERSENVACKSICRGGEDNSSKESKLGLFSCGRTTRWSDGCCNCARA
jgi:hypothetical protein